MGVGMAMAYTKTDAGKFIQLPFYNVPNTIVIANLHSIVKYFFSNLIIIFICVL